jgi:hypothetical protein
MVIIALVKLIFDVKILMQTEDVTKRLFNAKWRSVLERSECFQNGFP